MPISSLIGFEPPGKGARTTTAIVGRLRSALAGPKGVRKPHSRRPFHETPPLPRAPATTVSEGCPLMHFVYCVVCIGCVPGVHAHGRSSCGGCDDAVGGGAPRRESSISISLQPAIETASALPRFESSPTAHRQVFSRYLCAAWPPWPCEDEASLPAACVAAAAAARSLAICCLGARKSRDGQLRVCK